MLTTHNFRTINPNLSQTPLCQALKTNLSKISLTSNTLRLSKFVWADRQQLRSNDLDIQSALLASEHYLNTGILPDAISVETALIDPTLHQLKLIEYKDNSQSALSISIAPCMGIFHEIITRSDKIINQGGNILDYISTQQIEPREDRLFQHGQLIETHNGYLRALKYPVDQIGKRLHGKYSKHDKKYLVVELDIPNLNVATGLVGVGLPAVSMFGLFINNHVQVQANIDRDLQFAVGLCQYQPNKPKLKHEHENHLRKAKVRCCLVIEARTDEEAERISQTFIGAIRIGGSDIRHLNCTYTNIIPNADWLKYMDEDVQAYLDANPDGDALDAAFSLMTERPLTLTVAGFALLNEPKDVSHLFNEPVMHAWAESVFRLTQLEKGIFNEKYLFKLTHKTPDAYLWEPSYY